MRQVCEPLAIPPSRFEVGERYPGAVRRLSSSWLILTIALSAVLGACADAGRPSAAEWESAWESFSASIPAEESLGDPPTRDECAEALAALRTSSADMTPSPDAALDGAVREWIQIAEMAFFECPPEGNEIDSMAKAYQELDRLEAEIETVLAWHHSGA